MKPADPRTLSGALDASAAIVKAAVWSAVEQVLLTLLGASQSATRIAERDLLLVTQLELRRQAERFRAHFNQAFDERIREEQTPRSDPRRKLGAADWQTLSLVDDREVEGRMFSDRLAQQMAHGCEWELRELASYTGTLLGLGRADEERNPLRPACIGHALYQAIESLTTDANARLLLVREFGAALAALLPGCYSSTIGELRRLRIAPMELSFRGVEGPGNHLTGVNSGYASLQPDDAPSTRAHAGDYATASPAVGLHRGPASTGGGFVPGPRAPSGAAPAADAQLMNLLRRLTQLASRQGDFDAMQQAHGSGGEATGAGRAADPWAASSHAPGAAWPASTSPQHPASSSQAAAMPTGADGRQSGGDLPGLMAVNLIRAHREELLQASTGKLDHMVIDVVGSLFDQILSDPRVPPQMARQIARLQLPVLRVALSDATFFSTRRHPVRRFVNRIASLACAFDDFLQGPGQQFLARVSEIVQEIVDGDFDQVDLYTEKVVELEQFIARQTAEQLEGNGAATVLENKESELHTQQRYLQQLKAALLPVTMPDYLRAFLCQVWSQALVLATRRDGADSDLTRRLRNVGRDAVLSVQPKGSPPMRKRFLMQLPALMRDLNEGLALIGWPPAARKQFLDQFLPSHAESLKGASLTELDYNLLGRQLETIFAAPIPVPTAAAAEFVQGGTGSTPGGGALLPPASDDSPRREAELPSSEIERRFSPREAEQVGLVPESAVDWNGIVDVDIDLSDDAPVREPVTEAGDVDGGAGAGGALGVGLDIDLTLTAADPGQAPTGAALMSHIRLGFAYQMLLKDEWQKVRLTYVSPARSFFVFSRGREHQETISVTTRMLARMCETGRLRAVENAYLMERATARARRQLAALKAPPTQH